MERLLEKNSRLDPNKLGQKIALRKIQEAVELLYQIVGNANENLQKQLDEYKKILNTRRQSQKPNASKREKEETQ